MIITISNIAIVQMLGKHTFHYEKNVSISSFVYSVHIAENVRAGKDEAKIYLMNNK